jgi:hypothetical protein
MFRNGNSATGGGKGWFPTHVEYGAGNVPSSCYGDDFDNDGDQDVVTADISSGTISVFLNDGDGTFAPRAVYATGASCRQVYGGDFDGDNDIDLVATSSTTGRIFLFYNTGNGSYAPGVVYTDVQAGPFSVETGDYDADGHIDIAVGCRTADSLTVLTNDGDGTFTTTGHFKSGISSTNDGPWDLAANDLDGDGDCDLVGVDSDINRVVVMVNDGTGAFPTRKPVASGVFPLGVFAADVEGDGDIDVLCSNFASASVGVYKNDGTGTLTLDALLPTDLSGSYAWAHDLDDDGDLDLSVVDENADSLFIFYNGDSPVGVEIADGAPPGDGVVGGARGATAIAAWPNPALAGRGTMLRLSGFAASRAPVVIDVFALDGRLVRRIWNAPLAAAEASLAWDGRDARGRTVAPGRYIVSAASGDVRRTQGVQLVR